MTDIVEELRSNSALPICPFDKRSPEYWTTPNDKPCKFCGSEPEGPDKCTGADMRIMIKAAAEIERLRLSLSEARATGRREGMEEAARIARGAFRSNSMYDQNSPLYGSDLSPDRSEFGRGKDAGRSDAAAAIRAAMEKEE